MSWKSDMEATVNGRIWTGTQSPRVGLVQEVANAYARIMVLEEQLNQLHSYLGVELIYKGTHLQKITEEAE
jgi:ClpP class serine protease